MKAKKYFRPIAAAALALMLAGCAGESTAAPVQTREPVVLETAAMVTEPLMENTYDRSLYQEAMDWLDQGDELEACKLLMEIRDDPDASRVLQEIIGRRARELAVTFDYCYGIRTDGTVALREVYSWNGSGYEPIESVNWTDIVAVVTDTEAGVVGLREDGTIVTVNTDTEAAKTMSGWTDIVAIYGYFGEVLGLRADGRVLMTTEDPNIEAWEDIVEICPGGFSCYALRKDGTVVTDYGFDVSGWTDVIQVAAGDSFVLGLRSDGTVLAASSDGEMEQAVSGWTDMVAIDAYAEAMGLRADGTVAATNLFFGDTFMEMDAALDYTEWTDIVAIDTWGATFMGLKSDGTLMAAGLDEGGQLNVGHWKNIKAVRVANYSTFGLREDGTLLATDFAEEALWTDIRCPGE